MELEHYLTFLSQLGQSLDALARLEQQKIQAVQAGDLAALEACMKKEQAASMDLRGKEQKRRALLTELGLASLPLRELASHCPPQYRGRAGEVSQQVLRSYQVLTSAQKAARTLMESNLRHIQRELERRTAPQQVQPSAPHGTQADFRV